MKYQSILLSFCLLFVFASYTYAEATPVTECRVLTTNMGKGATDATNRGEVTKLQKFLIAQGFLQAMDDAQLGTFGSQTYAAVISFQKKYSITPTGTVGPLTRARIQEISCENTSTVSQTPSTSTAAPTSVRIVPGAPKPVITLKVNNEVVKSGDIVTFPRLMEYGNSGVKLMTHTAYIRYDVKNTDSDRCYRTTYPFPGVEQEYFIFNGSDSFAASVFPNASTTYVIRCTGPGGEATSTLTLLGKPQESKLPKPTITLKVNGAVVKSGETLTLPEGSVRIRYDVTNVNSDRCYRTTLPFPGVEQEYFIFNGSETFSLGLLANASTTYKIRCVGNGGEATSTITIVGKAKESTTPKPVITLKVNNQVVKSGDIITFPREVQYGTSKIMSSTAYVRYDVTNMDSDTCYRTKLPEPGVEQEYYLPGNFAVLVGSTDTITYKIRCVGPGGESNARITLTGLSTTSKVE